MIRFEFVNDRTGTDAAANYNVRVVVNHRLIAEGRVEGHPRAEHWSALLRRFVVAAQPKTDDMIVLDSILTMMDREQPEGLNWPGVARLIRRCVPLPSPPGSPDTEPT